MRRNSLFLSGIAITLLLLLCVPSVWGQATTSVRGSISDPSGAAIPNATVRLINTGTNLGRTAATDSQGGYTFVQVSPGEYELTVEASGFAKYDQKGIQLLVNLPATVNVKMKLGSASQTVTVTERAPLLNTTDASEGNTMGTTQLEQLPIEARDVVQLLSLQPGVVYASDRPDFTSNMNDTRQGSVNGEKSDQNNVTLDGTDDNEQNSGSAFQSVLPVPIESLQEFRVTTSNYGADQGRSAGAQVALVTKGGTNQFHGSLYEFNRSGVGEANDYFIKATEGETGQPNVPPHLVRNVLGADLGGPIKKDRLFYFVNYEGHRLSEADSEVREIPSASLRDGVIMYECASGCANPTTVMGVSGKTYTSPSGYYALGPSQIKAMDPDGIGPDPASLAYFNSYPMPNDQTVGDNFNYTGYRFAAPSSERDDWLVARLDYKLNSTGSQTLFWRGSGANDNNPQAPFLPGTPPENTVIDRSKGFVAGYTAVLRPDLVNNLRWGLTRQSLANLGDSDQPWVFIRGLDQGITYTDNFTLPVNDIADDVAWTKGNHSLTFGTDIFIVRNSDSNLNSSFSNALTNSDWVDTGGFAGVPQSSLNPANNGYPGVADAFDNSYDWPLIGMMGIVTQDDAQYNYNLSASTGTLQSQGSPVTRHWDSDEYDLYAQDSWKLRPSLTVNYGLRYELMSPVWEADGQQVTPTINMSQWFAQRGINMLQGIPSNASPNISFDVAGPKYGKPGYFNWQTKDFAPTVSFAWSPSADQGWVHKIFGSANRSVIRGGFGMYYDHFGQELVQTFDQSGGAFGLSYTLVNPANQLSVDDFPRLTSFNSIPTTAMDGTQLYLPSPATETFPDTFPLGNLCICFGVDNSLKTPYSYAMNLSYQRQLTSTSSIEVSYIGHMGHRLLTQDDMATPMDLVDPKTHVDYFSAAQALAKLYEGSNPPASTSVTPAMVGPTASYWQDMMFQPLQAGGAYTLECSGGATTSALQAAYDLWSCTPGNETDALYSQDIFGMPDANLPGVNYFPEGGQYSYFDNQYSSLYTWRTMAPSWYNGLQVVLQKQMSRGLQFNFNYTYSHSIDWASDAERIGVNNGTGPGGIINAWDPNQMKASSDFDLRHQINANWVWRLPIGRGEPLAGGISKGLDEFIGGWQLSGLARWSSGFPAEVDNGAYFPTDWQLEGEAVTTGSAIPQGKSVVDGFVNMFSNPNTALAGFRHAYPGETGSRNVLRGDGYADLDGGLDKTWKMPYNDQHSLEFEWNVFNTLNQTRFNVQNASLEIDSANTFGRYTHLLTNPRIMQFGLRYAF
ncbi:MAG: TonB-dependent receptor [Candidatus Acidiferrales bacterium]